jgi:hypothetical protein
LHTLGTSVKVFIIDMKISPGRSLFRSTFDHEEYCGSCKEQYRYDDQACTYDERSVYYDITYDECIFGKNSAGLPDQG